MLEKTFMQYRALVASTAAALLTGLAACGDDSASSGGGVAITATDSSCDVATTTFTPGTVTFKVTNKGRTAS